ncbi:divalent-cation tolerance protein CutA [Altericroceibacterium endophyticum]|uniref:Divalent cation tolerance protein CutA n=1 Tax=Altericroceibacterium endophyticum TaxID=1808508 RepID=A0A6I4T587_9SPHN|nr:divalent-cation tolerance protein CutA [Altericroceibacterium endophyticum]MXO65609.1 divalent cation tolerance protein CutA [Altericroceibacterium endophyticum]
MADISPPAALIWCPFENAQDARQAARILLSEGLVACANIMPDMQSLYIWEGEQGEAQECGALFKTAPASLITAIARLEEIHPYDTPAIIGWNADETTPATRSWLANPLGSSAG